MVIIKYYRYLADYANGHEDILNHTKSVHYSKVLDHVEEKSLAFCPVEQAVRQGLHFLEDHYGAVNIKCFNSDVKKPLRLNNKKEFKKFMRDQNIIIKKKVVI